MASFFFLVHVAGAVLLLALGSGWALAAHTRRRTLLESQQQQQQKRQRQRTSRERVNADTCTQDHSTVNNGGTRRVYPKVGLVMPARSKGEHLLANWESQVKTNYKGSVQAFIVVGSEKDPAYAAALGLRDSTAGNVEIEVVVAGPARTCSQKIHNQIAGFKTAPSSTEFVLFLDDDIEITPDTIGSFVAEMESNPEALLVTGYPLDIPSSSFASYATAAFHLPLSIVFSFDGFTPFVWGGCMMFRAADLRSDKHSIISSLKDGCYSDDMTLGAIASENSRLVLCPGYSLFLQRLPSNLSLADTWRYLRRQVFTCTTYSSTHNFFVNQLVMWLHCLLSFVLVASIARSLVLTSLLLSDLLKSTGVSLLLPLTPVARRDGALTLLHICSWLFCALCLRSAQRHGVLLCCSLQNLDLSSKKVQALLETSNPLRVWAGLIVLNAMVPPCSIVALFKRKIVWSGIEYVRKHGKVFVHH